MRRRADRPDEPPNRCGRPRPECDRHHSSLTIGRINDRPFYARRDEENLTVQERVIKPGRCYDRRRVMSRYRGIIMEPVEGVRILSRPAETPRERRRREQT